MTRIKRQAITAAALAAAVVAPTMAEAQANQRIPVVIVVTFKSPGEPKLGIETGEAIRQRLLRQYPLERLRPGSIRTVKTEEIAAALTGSGFPTDSAISTSDLRDLGRQFGASESMEGTVKRTAQGVEGRARFYVNSNMDAPEVLPVIVDKDAGAVGRKIADEFLAARKALPDYERCKNAIINNQLDQAVAAANAATAQYSKSILARACLLTAYQKKYETKSIALDSLVRVANEIISVDPDNLIALTQLVEAARARGDTTEAIKRSMQLFRLNTMNTSIAGSVIEFLGSVGAPGPDSALVVTQVVKANNPGDATFIEKEWKLLLNASQWKRAIAAGEEMVKFDTSKADTLYFRRQTGAALQDSQPQLALQFLARATAKFPTDVRLLQAYVSELRKQGQIQQALEVAKKVVAVDPKADQGYATIVFLYTQLNQGDSALAFARQALASADTATKTQIGQGLLSLITPSVNEAQKLQADTTLSPDLMREKWTRVYQMSAAVDSIAPTMYTAFYMSVAASYLANNALGRVQGLARANNNAAACAELKAASDMVLVVDLNMSRGGRVDGGTAANILNIMSQIRPYIQQTRQQLKCK